MSCDPAPGMQPDVICFAEELPFADSSSFDLAVTRVAAHHFADVAPGDARARPRRRASGSSSSTTSTAATPSSEAEKLRDPSHVRNYTEEEWRGFFAGSGHRASRRCASSPTRSSSSRGSSARSCTGEDAERVRALLADRITDGDVVLRADRARGQAAR